MWFGHTYVGATFQIMSTEKKTTKTPDAKTKEPAASAEAAAAEGTSGGKRTSVMANSLIWFGAGVSIAEILTGVSFAPLGFARGIAAIVLGHVIGCALFFLAGLMGARTRKSSMETVKMSFGHTGGLLFAVLNIIQLVGWTSIMIYDGSLSASSAFPGAQWLWALVIGVLIAAWIVIGVDNLDKVNYVAMILLFILTLVMCRVIFFSGAAPSITPDDTFTFGMAVELAVSMPLSWLPVVSDYTREAEKPVGATVASTLVYMFASMWMFLIGMGAAIYTGSSDIAQIMVGAGMGVAGLLVVVFSTVTTTFLDSWSAGISYESVFPRPKGKVVALIAVAVGTVAAMVWNMDNITNFLYLIGSVFAPMIGVMIADFYIARRDSEKQAFDWPNLVVWLVGFVAYRLLMHVDTPVGYTIIDVAITVVLALAVDVVRAKAGKGKAKAAQAA